MDAADETLTQVCDQTSSPDACADLAAVRLALSERPSFFETNLDALAAADRALRLAPNHGPALFNRALALERLGLIEPAREAWIEAARDPDPVWSAESRAAADRLTPRKSERFDGEALVRAADAGDVEQCRRIVRTFSRDGRGWGEALIPARWAEAVKRGDDREAGRLLDVMRVVADAIGFEFGERMAHDSLHAIQQASGGDRAALADAYLIYRDGRIAHQKHAPVVAYQQFMNAARLFERGRSPMALTARYYMGSALHAQGRTADVITQLRPLWEMRLAERGYRHLEAHVGWEYGLSMAASGALSDAIGIHEASRRDFADLNDLFSRAAIEEFLADTLDDAGETERAWLTRRDALVAMYALGARDRTAVALTAAVDLLVRKGEWERSLALASVSITEATSLKAADLAAQAYLYRAIIRERLGSPDGGRADLQEAMRWRSGVGDHAVVGRLEAEEAFTNGLLEMQREPTAALASFDRAAQLLEARRNPRAVTRVYLERARCLRRLGNLAGARENLGNTIAILERRRRGVHDAEQRALTLAEASEVFAEAIGVELDAGHERAAFDLSERGRARALLDLFERRNAAAEEESIPLDAGQIRDALASDAAIVAYSELPDRFVAYVLRPDRVKVVSAAVPPGNVRRDLMRCADAMRRAEAFERPCAAARDLLIGSVERELDGVAHVTFISDVLGGLPIGALESVRPFGLGPRSITEAPSATLAIRCARRARELDTGSGRALVVATTQFDRAGNPALALLPWATAEGERVSALYRDAVHLEGAEVTRRRLLTEMPRARLIHIAGHAVGAGRAAAARLLVAPAADDGTLDALTISRMNLRGTRFVYLSTCDSAKNDRADGVGSLAVAFLVAGVPSVAAAKWQVDDAAAPEAAESLHRAVASGEDPAVAARDGSTHQHMLARVIVGASRYLVRD